MGWERRKGSSGLYYTRSRRVHGLVRREYVGCGEVARLAAEMDAAKREARAAQRAVMAEQQQAEWARREAIYATVMGPLDTLETLCRVEIGRELEAAGYHQHDRGEWRRKRRGGTERGTGSGDTGANGPRTE